MNKLNRCIIRNSINFNTFSSNKIKVQSIVIKYIKVNFNKNCLSNKKKMGYKYTQTLIKKGYKHSHKKKQTKRWNDLSSSSTYKYLKKLIK